MESRFSHLDLLIWLDDMLRYASDADRLVAMLKAAFEICLEKGLSLTLARAILLLSVSLSAA